MVKITDIKIDSGKKTANCLEFNLEKKIKEYKEGIDYRIDQTGNFYIILSERLKSVIWPDDYFWYNESVVAIDRQGKIESWRIATENPREPYKKVNGEGVKEIMGDFLEEKEKELVVKEQGRQKSQGDKVNNVSEQVPKEASKQNIIPWVGRSCFVVGYSWIDLS